MFQQVIVIGNLGAEPEMRYTPDGTPVTNFSVAVNERWTNSDGSSGERVTWFRVTAWRRLAEICDQYLAKGRRVMVIGQVRASAWLDQEGNARASLELTARGVKFLDSANGEDDNGSYAEDESPEDEDLTL